jgi:hypothetical protein
MAVLDAHLKATAEAQKMSHAQERHRMDVAQTALGMAATVSSHEVKMKKNNMKDKPDV